jgi:integrase
VSLYKRGRIYWTYVWQNGVRHAKSTGTGNLRIAQKIDLEFKDNLSLASLGRSVPRPEMTFGELAARFIAEASPKPHHLDRLKVLLPRFADTPIGRINKGSVRDYRAKRHAEKRVSDATVNRDCQVLRHLLYWAMDEGYLTANPLARMPLVPERRKPRVMMTVGEESLLLRAAAPHLRPIIVIGLDTGMRRGEILSQQWEHVDLARGLLCVTRSKTPGGEGREIPFTQRLQSLLASNPKPSGLVFTYEGRPIRRIKTAWKHALARAGIRYSRFHDLRHVFNVRLIEAGVIQEVRKALMGHSIGRGAHGAYVHIELPTKREAIRKLEAWWLSQVQSQPQLPTGDRLLLPSPKEVSLSPDSEERSKPHDS